MLGLKAGVITATWQELAATPLPAIAQQADGRYVVLAKVQDGKVLIQDPREARPLVLSKEDFTKAWAGPLIFSRSART